MAEAEGVFEERRQDDGERWRKLRGGGEQGEGWEGGDGRDSEGDEVGFWGEAVCSEFGEPQG